MYIYIHVYTYILTYLTLPYLTLHYITLHYIHTHTQIYIYCIHFCPYVQPNEKLMLTAFIGFKDFLVGHDLRIKFI